MIIFREKWLWALCLAILVHVGFFFIFYLNMNKEDRTQTSDSRINIAQSSVATDVKSDYPPSIAKTYTATTDKTVNIDKASQDDITEIKLTTNAEPLTSSNEDRITSSQNAKEDNFISKKTVITLKNRTQDNQNSQADEASLVASNNNETLEDIKNRAGLLAIDTPTQSSNIQLDKAYLSAKSEVDDINNQLSAAINEVKKRNQQKIDERQQLRNSANTTDDQGPSE